MYTSYTATSLLLLLAASNQSTMAQTSACGNSFITDAISLTFSLDDCTLDEPSYALSTHLDDNGNECGYGLSEFVRFQDSNGLCSKNYTTIIYSDATMDPDTLSSATVSIDTDTCVGSYKWDFTNKFGSSDPSGSLSNVKLLCNDNYRVTILGELPDGKHYYLYYVTEADDNNINDRTSFRSLSSSFGYRFTDYCLESVSSLMKKLLVDLEDSSTSSPLNNIDCGEDKDEFNTCTDVTGWYDSGGVEFDCKFYSSARKTNLGITPCENWGFLYENFGKTANDACCACGGGLDTSFDNDDTLPSPSSTSSPVSLPTSPTPSPTPFFIPPPTPSPTPFFTPPTPSPTPFFFTPPTPSPTPIFFAPTTPSPTPFPTTRFPTPFPTLFSNPSAPTTPQSPSAPPITQPSAPTGSPPTSVPPPPTTVDESGPIAIEETITMMLVDVSREMNPDEITLMEEGVVDFTNEYGNPFFQITILNAIVIDQFLQVKNNSNRKQRRQMRILEESFTNEVTVLVRGECKNKDTCESPGSITNMIDQAFTDNKNELNDILQDSVPYFTTITDVTVEQFNENGGSSVTSSEGVPIWVWIVIPVVAIVFLIVFGLIAFMFCCNRSASSSKNNPENPIPTTTTTSPTGYNNNNNNEKVQNNHEYNNNSNNYYNSPPPPVVGRQPDDDGPEIYVPSSRPNADDNTGNGGNLNSSNNNNPYNVD